MLIEEQTADTPANAEAEPQSFKEHLGEVFDRFSSTADAEEPAAEPPAPADETVTPDQDGPAAPAETTPKPEPEKIEVTADQLADSKYWGSLDSEGWKRMERDYPVQTKYVKSAQAAATRIVNEATAEKRSNENRAAAPTHARETASPDDEPSPELLAAVEELNDIDPVVVAKAHLKIARLTAPTLAREIGVDPIANQQKATLAAALTDAVERMPELTTFNADELNAVVESSPALMALAETGTQKNITLVMVESGRILKERKAASAATQAAAKAEADRKKSERQQVVKSNARPATRDILNPHGNTPSGKVPLRQRLGDKFDEVTTKLH